MNLSEWRGVPAPTPILAYEQQEKKALLCLFIAQSLFPDANNELIENNAARLMFMPFDAIKGIEDDLKKAPRIKGTTIPETIGLSRYDLIKGEKPLRQSAIEKTTAVLPKYNLNGTPQQLG